MKTIKKYKGLLWILGILLISFSNIHSYSINAESGKLILDGENESKVLHGRYVYYYSQTLESYVINIVFMNWDNNQVWLKLVENKNPFMFYEVKSAIEKHLDSWIGYQGGSFYSLFGNITFYYNTNDPDKNIIGFAFYKYQI